MNLEKLRAEFLACETYEDYNARRDEFRQLDPGDPEIQKHLFALMDTKGEEPFDQYPFGVHVDTKII